MSDPPTIFFPIFLSVALQEALTVHKYWKQENKLFDDLFMDPERTRDMDIKHNNKNNEAALCAPLTPLRSLSFNEQE